MDYLKPVSGLEFGSRKVHSYRPPERWAGWLGRRLPDRASRPFWDLRDLAATDLSAVPNREWDSRHGHSKSLVCPEIDLDSEVLGPRS
jgi:hypothetical protein